MAAGESGGLAAAIGRAILMAVGVELSIVSSPEAVGLGGGRERELAEIRRAIRGCDSPSIPHFNVRPSSQKSTAVRLRFCSNFAVSTPTGIKPSNRLKYLIFLALPTGIEPVFQP